MKHLLKSLIEKKIINYSALVLEFYYLFNLTEDEAVALIKLNTLLEEKHGIIKPEKFSKRLSKTPQETSAILESLMKKGYLSIKLIKNKDGKEQETFDIDYFLIKVIAMMKTKQDETRHTKTTEWVDFLEETLQKPLSPLDIELVSKWIDEDGYPLQMVKEATLESLKSTRPTFQQIDRILLTKMRDIKPQPKKKEVLKEFYKLWEE